MGSVRTEVCVESVDGVRFAIDAGADRVELCTDLDVDGLTPPIGLIEQAVAAASDADLAVHVLIRCRAGDFVYTDAEVAVMDGQIRQAVDAGADGVVIGALQDDGAVDLAAVRRWVATAREAAITFHRAFDVVADPLAALAELADAGVDRILTSGQAPTAPQGSELLAQLVSCTAGRTSSVADAPAGSTNPGASTGTRSRAVTILAGGGIRPDNVRELIGRTGVTEVHFSGRQNGTIDADIVRSTVAAAGRPMGHRTP